MRKDAYFIGLLVAIEAASFPLVAYLMGSNTTIVTRSDPQHLTASVNFAMWWGGSIAAVVSLATYIAVRHHWIVIDPLIMAYGFILAIQWLVAIVAARQFHGIISDNPRGPTWLTYLSGNMVILSMTLSVAAAQIQVQ